MSMQEHERERKPYRFRRTLLLTAAISVAVLIFVVAQIPSGSVQKNMAFSLIGQRAPDFSFPAWNGTSHEQVRLSQWQKHVVVINFWASWCEACRLEVADLEATWRKYKPRSIMFMGVAVQDNQADGTAFLRRYGVTYPSGPDGSGSIAQTYLVTNVGVPETILVNRRGIVVNKYIGAIDQATLDQAIAAAST